MSDIYRTCNAADLHVLTADGWTLHETREESHIEPGGSYSDTVVVNGFSQSVFKVHPSLVVKKTLFVLRKTGETALSEANEIIKSYQDTIKSLTAARNLALKTAKESETELTRQIGENGLLITRCDERAQELKAERERSRKMETDLAKVRKEVGEARWRQIVGEGQ